MNNIPLSRGKITARKVNPKLSVLSGKTALILIPSKIYEGSFRKNMLTKIPCINEFNTRIEISPAASPAVIFNVLLISLNTPEKTDRITKSNFRAG